MHDGSFFVGPRPRQKRPSSWYYILLLLIVPLGEVHRIWSAVDWPIDLFLFKDRQEDIEWIARDVSSMLQFLIIAFIAWKRPNLDPLVLLAVVGFAVMDIIFYFLTFKTGCYALVYYIMAIIALIKLRRR